MSRNIGDGEQVLRLAIGVVLIGLALFADLQPGWALIVLGAGAVMLSTALLRYCAINAILGRNSSRRASPLSGPPHY